MLDGEKGGVVASGVSAEVEILGSGPDCEGGGVGGFAESCDAGAVVEGTVGSADWGFEVSIARSGRL